MARREVEKDRGEEVARARGAVRQADRSEEVAICR